MFGVNRSAQRYVQTSGYDYGAIELELSIDDVLSGNSPEPNFPTVFNTSFLESGDRTTKRESGYGLIRLSLADPFKLMLGGNLTHATSEGFSYGATMVYDWTRFLPFVGATLDLSDSISAYASFATIFNPQTQTTANRELIDPIKGDNIEAGVKGEWMGGRLNASLALFQARQKNTAEAAGFDATIGQTIYRGIDAKSQGIEFEFAGLLAPGLQATGGYTIMRVRGENDEPVRTFVPRQLGRLTLTYSPPALPALKVGAAVQYQSKIYLEPAGITSVTTGRQVRITQPKYALLDLLASYRLTDNLQISANLKNVTNAKYLTALNYDQGYYGAPRTILGTISLKY